VPNVSFCSKNSLEKVVTDRKLIFNTVVKYSLQMQQRSLKALWCLLLFQKWVKLTLCLCSQVLKYSILLFTILLS